MPHGFLKLAALAGALAAWAGAAQAASFDARNPRDVATVLSAGGLKVTVDTSGPTPFVAGEIDGVRFVGEFYECDAAKSRCNVLAYGASWAMPTVNVQDLNGWNNWTFMCPAYKDRKDGTPHLWYGLGLTGSETPETIRSQFTTWRGCIDDFQQLLADPQGWLKAN